MSIYFYSSCYFFISFSPFYFNFQIQDLEDEFSRTEETVQTTEDMGYTLVKSGNLEDEAKEGVERDLESLHREWKELKSQRYSSLISRYLFVEVIKQNFGAGR